MSWTPYECPKCGASLVALDRFGYRCMVAGCGWMAPEYRWEKSPGKHELLLDGDAIGSVLLLGNPVHGYLAKTKLGQVEFRTLKAAKAWAVRNSPLPPGWLPHKLAEIEAWLEECEGVSASMSPSSPAFPEILASFDAAETECLMIEDWVKTR